MPVFEARLDPGGIRSGADAAKKSIEQVGDSFDRMKSKGTASTSSISSALGAWQNGLQAYSRPASWQKLRKKPL